MSADPNPEHIEQDLRRMIGGDFSPDSVGLEVHEAVTARVRSAPDEYLDALDRLFLGIRFDAELQSHLDLPSALKLLADLRPRRVGELLERVLKQFDAVMAIHDQAVDRSALLALLPDETVGLTQRLEVRRRQLRAMLASVRASLPHE